MIKCEEMVREGEDQFLRYQEYIMSLSDEEARKFIDQMSESEINSMGFYGEEGVEDGSDDQ